MKKTANGLKLIFPLMILCLCFISFKIYSQNKEIAQLKEKISLKNQVYNEIFQSISDLEEEINSSDTLSFVEKIARDEYKMVKPKEIIFIDKDKDL